MNIETCYRLLLSEVHRFSQADIDMAMISIIKAMDFYKSFPFDFNNGWEQVFFREGSDLVSAHPAPAGFPAVRPGLPHGIRRPIVLQVVALVTSGDVSSGTGAFTYTPVSTQPLRQVTPEALWSMEQGVGEITTSSTGYPECFAWLGNGQIRIYPRPFTDMLVDAFFVKDAMRPRYTWVSGVDGSWVFEQLSVNNALNVQYWQWEELQPTFTNAWLEHAEPMIRARARFELHSNFYNDLGAAQMARQTLAEEEGRHRYEAISGMIGSLSKVPSPL